MPNDYNFIVVIKYGAISVNAAMVVAVYIYRFCNRLDAHPFEYVRNSEPMKTIRNYHCEERLKRDGMWINLCHY